MLRGLGPPVFVSAKNEAIHAGSVVLRTGSETAPWIDATNAAGPIPDLRIGFTSIGRFACRCGADEPGPRRIPASAGLAGLVASKEIPVKTRLFEKRGTWLVA